MRKQRKIIVKKFNAIFQEEKVGYFVSVPDLPGCVSEGDTFEEAKKNIKEAIELYLEDTPKNKIENLIPSNPILAPISVRLYA